MEKYSNKALVIVDTQRGFMPAYEGKRLGIDGCGELGVDGGEQVVSPINQLTDAFHRANLPIATTQDYHPTETAHFSDNPNFTNTWPIHCVGGTPGAELHPDLLAAKDSTLATQFIKGDVACTSPEDDTSYTGALAYNPDTKMTLPDWLDEKKTTSVYVTGLALGDGAEQKLCVDSTAADLYDMGYDVTLVTDAVEAVMSKNRELCFRNLGKRGIRLATSNEVMKELEG
ncbi:MAG TPA: isochorismatase family protein [Candidatus Saccharimonadales bacterium]|nr:isochorismatase family protein [Candidatus Saccharimonadales bacterium]